MKVKIILFCFVPICMYSQTWKVTPNVRITECYNVNFETISKQKYNKCAKYEIIPTNENKIQKKDSTYNLFFVNKSIILQDKGEEDDPSFVRYNYLYSFFDILCFEVKYYEISTTLLIEKKTGMFIEILGKFVFSPNGSFLFCASQLSNYEPFPNNIQIYKIINGQIRLISEYFLENWIPDNIKWINANTIFFEQKYCNNKIEYAKITIDEI